MESRAVGRRRRIVVALAVALGLLAAFVLWWFQPQKLFINETVNEAAPTVAVPGAVTKVLAAGELHSGEHHTTGSVQLLDVGAGRTVLRLVRLRTSNGPAVHVWLSAARPDASDGAIGRADHVDLGGLKGNIGSQNYAVPNPIDARRFQSVVVWCSRFHVAFGAAPLTPV